MKALARRVALVSAWIAPPPDPRFLAYARVLVAWDTGAPDEDAATRLARWLAERQGPGEVLRTETKSPKPK